MCIRTQHDTPHPNPRWALPLPSPLHRRARRLLLLGALGVGHHHAAGSLLRLLRRLLEQPLDGVGRLLRGLVRGLALQAHRLE